MSAASRRRARPVAPIDAASLVLVRGTGRDAEVLMGRRRARTSFLPGVYVFPGGRLDTEDADVPPDVGLRPEVARKVARRCRSVDPTALAMAVVRETFEETGLLLCAPGGRHIRHDHPDTPLWRAFAAARSAPAVDALDYVARAITPASSHRRFNTRFFVADATCARGELLRGGELLDLRWVRLAAAARLDVVDVTEFVLDQVAAHLAAPPPARARRPVPLLYYVNDAGRVVYE